VSQAALEAVAAAHDPLPALRQAKLTLINGPYEDEFRGIKQQYQDAKRESWPIQLSEAACLAADTLAPTSFLDALLVARGFGEIKAELAAKVKAKNQTCSALSASLTDKRGAQGPQALGTYTVAREVVISSLPLRLRYSCLAFHHALVHSLGRHLYVLVRSN
jgi:hypothetical protein